MNSKPDLEDILYRLLNNIPDNRYPSNYKKTHNSENHSSSIGLAKLESDEIRYLCEVASGLFLAEPTLLRLQAPIKICGKICGHYNDLLRLLDRGGHPPTASYLFLGGYVNRGAHSLETLCLMLVYKILYPNQFYMLRGSHETELKASTRGLKSECEARSLEDIWPDLLKLFDCLPLAALVNDRIFCCYGGPPAKLDHLDDINNIQRPLTAPHTELGIAADLLYSKTNLKDPGWVPLERGHLYGKEAIESFLSKFDIATICRARQMALDGYGLFSDSAELITLLSVPNYCGRVPNDGALMQVSDNLTVSLLILESEPTENFAQQDGDPDLSSLSQNHASKQLDQDSQNLTAPNSSAQGWS